MNVFIYFLSVILCLFIRFPVYADMVATASNSDAIYEVEIFSDQQESPSAGSASSIVALNYAVSPRAITESDLVNCVRYDVVIDREQYVLLLPSDYESDVMVDSDGYLWNMSTANIQGRLFSGSFDPTADTGMLLYLGPCLGNNFNNNNRYGSPNYIRDYYWSGNSLTYDTEYVVVEVVDTFWLFKSSDMLAYVIIFLVGSCLVCLWKRS